ncbi:MAG: T9SS type A sorting domain-containing protein [Ignavibacteria bacterium]
MGNTQAAKLTVYNSLGQKVSTLLNEVKTPGNYEIEFNGSNLASGVYFYKLTSGSFVQTNKMLLLK